MQGTMQREPLVVRSILDYGLQHFPASAVSTLKTSGEMDHRTFESVATGSARLANALRDLGVTDGARVATLCWNHDRHLEAYLAVPTMGAVLLTLNLRLSGEQLRTVVTDAEPRVLIVDSSLLDVAQSILGDDGCGIEHLVVVPDDDTAPPTLPNQTQVHHYEDLVADQSERYDWPDLDEDRGAVMCYTTGTTGAPKGVVYSHRSIYLHSLAGCTANSFAIAESDRVVMIVPMFHANAWGIPYSAWMSGADVLFPGANLGGPDLARLIEREKATFAAGVPTIWTTVLHEVIENGADLSSMRMVVGGGSATSLALIERWTSHTGVPMVQGWGMTETSPLAALAREPKNSADADRLRWRSKTGRPVFGVEMRVVDESGNPVQRGLGLVGEVQVRGPWITGSYHRNLSPESFQDGWLRTGDVGRVDESGYLQITDRAKDVIKSGGEWVSSVELEGHLQAHPDVLEVAVIGVPDDRWEERPMVFVVPRDRQLTAPDLAAHLVPLVPRWWLPERWAFVESIPKTSVGKLDKLRLREIYAHPDGQLVVEEISN